MFYPSTSLTIGPLCRSSLPVGVTALGPSMQLMVCKGLSIFSPQIFLPLQPAMDKLVLKLFSVHIAGSAFDSLRVLMRV
jgi:hypothetical protein